MYKTIYTRQGEFLREDIVKMRKKAGLNQRQLAARLGREQNLIGRLEKGERRLDVIEFYWLCRACGINPQSVARRLFKAFEQIEESASRQRTRTKPGASKPA